MDSIERALLKEIDRCVKTINANTNNAMKALSVQNFEKSRRLLNLS